MKKLLLLTGILLSVSAYGQDGVLSQFMASPVWLNPAFTGQFPGILRFTAGYKQQWKQVVSPYTISTGSAEVRIDHRKGGYTGLAAGWYADRAGVARTGLNAINLVASRAIALGQLHTLAGGACFSLAQHVSDLRHLTWDNQYDGTGWNAALPPGEDLLSSRPYFDISAGLAWIYERPEKYITANNDTKIKVGVRASHITRPLRTFHTGGTDRVPFSFGFQADAQLPLPNTKWIMRPVMYLDWNRYYRYIYPGMLMGLRIRDRSVYSDKMPMIRLYMGGLVRVEEGIAAQLFIEYWNFQFGASYDIALSALSNHAAQRGGIEFSVRCLFNFERGTHPVR